MNRTGARSRRVDWMRVYDLEQEIYGHIFTHLGAPPVTEHPQYLEGGDRFALDPGEQPARRQ